MIICTYMSFRLFILLQKISIQPVEEASTLPYQKGERGRWGKWTWMKWWKVLECQ
eukprot:m.89843 g.89843  ORF g.89843 m.89843 type:complete len:55 (+) comp36627_c0_seq3:108-272(+)